ncbi:ribosome-inactivating family protein [Streptomyces sp. NPDC059788]|uniref:ribosome-inactivating family protein n=1 Tax=Streptomyces sp. NPDC059788 TaxID=3346948 RepID=UPI0036645A51
MSTVRRVGRRLGVLLLALLTMGGLLDANATPAHAETHSNWSEIVWEIDDMRYQTSTEQGASRYRNLINNIRGLAAAERHLGSGADSEHLQETENQPNRFIEVIVREDGNRILSLYFQTRDMYLVGIATRNARYQWNGEGDTSALAQAYRQHHREAGNFHAVGYSENYRDLASEAVRGEFAYNPSAFYNRLESLSNMTRGNADTRRRDFAYVIQATSEAVRFDWIRDRIFQTIRDGESEPDPAGNRYQNLGTYGVGLTLNWTRLSTFVYQLVANLPATIIIAGNVYDSLQRLLYGVHGQMPGIGGILAASSKKPK